MDQITQGDAGLQVESELISPLSPKRPRTDCVVTSDHGGKKWFDFRDLLTFRKTTGSSSSTLGTSQQNADPVQCCNIDSEKAQEQLQDTKLTVPPVNELTPSRTDEAHAGSSDVCGGAVEIRFPFPVKDEQPALTETDRPASFRLDDAGGTLAESHTSTDSRADTSGPPDCALLGKSPERESPGGCGLPAGCGGDGRQVQNSVTPIHTLEALNALDEGVTRQPDCTYEETPCETGPCDAQSPSAGDEESTHGRNEHGVSENIVSSEKKKEAGDRLMTSSDYADFKSFYRNPEEEPSRNPAEGVKNKDVLLEMHICENETVAVGEGGTNVQVNENITIKKSFSSAAEHAQRSVASDDVLVPGHTALDNVSVEAGNHRRPKGEHAPGKMIVAAQSETSEHTAEILMPARISREPALGDNDKGPSSAIDPPIWREPFGERVCSPANSTGVEFKLSAPDQTKHFKHRSEGNVENSLCQSDKELQACFNADDGGFCHLKSSASTSQRRPTEPPPAGDREQEIHYTVGHQLTTEQDLSGCLSIRSVNLNTHELVECLDRATEAQGREEIKSCEEEIISDKQWKSEFSMDKEEHNQQQIEKCKEGTTEISTGDLIQHEELENNLDLQPDPLYGVVIATEEKDRQEEASVGEPDMHRNSETLAAKEEQHIPQREHETKSNLVRHTEQGNEFICFSDFQHGAETGMVDNEEDLLAFTPPTSDAVVPGPQQLIHSPNADNDDGPAVLRESDRFSPAPSALALVPEGFDTFEKIQFSLQDDSDDDDEEDDVGLGGSPLLSSLLFLASQQPQQAGENAERPSRHSGNSANGYLGSDRNGNEVPDFMSAADVSALRWREQQPNSRPAHDLAGRFLEDSMSSKSDSLDDPSDSPEFEMKERFDTVLRELKLFFEVSASDFVEDSGSRVASPEQRPDKTEGLKADGSNSTGHLCSPERGRHRDASSDEERSLDLCGVDPVVSCSSGDSEQEVPLNSHQCLQESHYTAERIPESREIEQKRRMWSPSFMCQPFLELSHRPVEPRRLEPLRTCTRPLRVGLSKRAKTKHLHRPHPYK